jgi:hypothetical protein
MTSSQIVAYLGWSQLVPESEIPFFSFDVYDLLERVKDSLPALKERKVDLWIAQQEPLACIKTETNVAHILIHSILNRADLPLEVMAFILGHELIHLIIKPRMIDGVMESHPPEFFEYEEATQPTRTFAWSWIFIALDGYIKFEKGREGIIVKRQWRKSRGVAWPSAQFITKLMENAHLRRIIEELI